jgi:hypothetical protein
MTSVKHAVISNEVRDLSSMSFEGAHEGREVRKEDLFIFFVFLRELRVLRGGYSYNSVAALTR